MNNFTSTKQVSTSEPTALAAWMRARGLSDAALAAALDCDRSFVFRLRTGQRVLRSCVRCRFVALYGAEAAGAVFGAEDGHGQSADAR